jgi:adenylate cyclase
MERRLAAILAVDVVGYSRLMSADEAGTLARLKALRRKLVQPRITERRGRIVKLMGDGLLAEFPSVVEAVQCAVDIQEQIVGRDADLPDEQRIKLRIGVNLGDVIVDGTDLYGDGVNVAARLEGLAEPGGICVSGKAYEEVKRKLPVAFEDLGEREVKNIPEAVRVYRWMSIPASPMQRGARSGGVPPLTDKPSIAVLPFTNMSGDPEQEYFSDGITEDIITELSRFPELFVIARNSAFAFKSKTVDTKDTAQRLGVRYLVEGSVRKAGSRVRITAQLIDASVGGHIWADRYDRELKDIFEVQDDVVRSIVAILPNRIANLNIEESRRKPTENLSALDYLMQGNYFASRRGATHERAIVAYKKAIELDPRCAAAYAGIATVEARKIWDFSTSDDDPRGRAYDNARKALAIDDNDYRSHGVIGFIYFERGEHEPARQHLERALRLNPNSTQIMKFWAMLLAYSGDPNGAIETYYRAMRLNPFSTETIDSEVLAEACFMAKQYDKSIAVLETALDRPYAHQQIAMCYAQLGDMEACARHMKLYRDQMPETYDELKLYESHMRLCQREEDKELWTAAYRKVGLDV